MAVESHSDAPVKSQVLVCALLELLELASGDCDPADYLSRALTLVLDAVGARYVALASPVSGQWTAVSGAGRARPLPNQLLADALDRDQPVAGQEWTIVPLRTAADRGSALAVCPAVPSASIESLAAALGLGLGQVRHRQHLADHVHRLETILEIAQQWYQVNEMAPLLVKMAEAATRLLHADRASIFLWDRPNRTLVGRPALGVEGGELRIADDTGIVGQVVHTAQPRRVGCGEADAGIDQQIADRLGYQAQTLLCVPLVSSSGKVLGAFEVLNKTAGDFTDNDQTALVELAAHAAIALEKTQQLQQLVVVHRQLVDQAAEGTQLIGQSAAVEVLRSTVERVANTDLAVLILGENGTGKEVVSRSIHYQSRRRAQPFIAINCAALPETLLESELFGHERGAFTDAREARPGKFELAAGGTLFLDEIGEMSRGGQAKMLRALEEKIIVRVGGSTSIHTDARVVAATNKNLVDMVTAGTFREDLYYRLNVVSIELPPLRERGDDVLQLADYFLAEFCRKVGRKLPKLTAAARRRLLEHPWPGNVRELRNLMERIACLLPEDCVEAHDLAFTLSPGRKQTTGIDPGLPLAEATHTFQAEHITTVIDAARGNMSTAAKRLGLHRSNLYRKMRQLGLGTGEDDTEDV
jgi:transcriptional regulator with GAF, ATPase, and Fis domain